MSGVPELEQQKQIFGGLSLNLRGRKFLLEASDEWSSCSISHYVRAWWLNAWWYRLQMRDIPLVQSWQVWILKPAHQLHAVSLTYMSLLSVNLPLLVGPEIFCACVALVAMGTNIAGKIRMPISSLGGWGQLAKCWIWWNSPYSDTISFPRPLKSKRLPSLG